MRSNHKLKSMLCSLMIVFLCICCTYYASRTFQQVREIDILQQTIQCLESELSSVQSELDSLTIKNNLASLSAMDKYKYLYRNGFLDGLVHGMNPDTKPAGNIGSIKTFEEEYETIRYVDEYLKDYDISSDLFEFTQLHKFK